MPRGKVIRRVSGKYSFGAFTSRLPKFSGPETSKIRAASHIQITGVRTSIQETT